MVRTDFERLQRNSNSRHNQKQSWLRNDFRQRRWGEDFASIWKIQVSRSKNTKAMVNELPSYELWMHTLMTLIMRQRLSSFNFVFRKSQICSEMIVLNSIHACARSPSRNLVTFHSIFLRLSFIKSFMQIECNNSQFSLGKIYDPSSEMKQTQISKELFTSSAPKITQKNV